jgi:hypothetical protein
MTIKLTPNDLKEIFSLLQKAELDAIVVGGQAVNLWASKYSERVPELNEYLPFASEDLDFYGGKIEAIACNQVLKGQVTLNKDLDPSPNTGVVVADFKEQKLRIDFLGSVFGLNDTEITDTALKLEGKGELAGVQLKVLHPILCLEGKLSSIKGLPQAGRQDIKHAKMSLLCLKELLKDYTTTQSSRKGLKLTERILKNALSENGLHAWYRHQIKVESAIPFSIIEQLQDEKWQKFCSMRVPKALEQIENKRNRYSEVMKQIEHRREDLAEKKTEAKINFPAPEQKEWAKSILPKLTAITEEAKQLNRVTVKASGVGIIELEKYNLEIDFHQRTAKLTSKHSDREVAAFDLREKRVIAANPNREDLNYWQSFSNKTQSNKPKKSSSKIKKKSKDIEL